MHFCTAIPTSPINFIQLFFILTTVSFFWLSLTKHALSWATLILGSILEFLHSFMLFSAIFRDDVSVKFDQMLHTCACVCTVMLLILAMCHSMHERIHVT